MVQCCLDYQQLSTPDLLQRDAIDFNVRDRPVLTLSGSALNAGSGAHSPSLEAHAKPLTTGVTYRLSAQSDRLGIRNPTVASLGPNRW